MKIIGYHTNFFLSEASHKPLAGFITGPARIIAGIAQSALNGIAFIFAKIFSLQTNKFLSDAKTGALHIYRGLLEFLPGTSFFMDMVIDGRIKVMTSDHPFRGTLID